MFGKGVISGTLDTISLIISEPVKHMDIIALLDIKCLLRFTLQLWFEPLFAQTNICRKAFRSSSEIRDVVLEWLRLILSIQHVPHLNSGPHICHPG
jgi:hypothetical protein